MIIRRAGKFIGVIALAAEPRPLGGEVMNRLRAQGIERLVMLIGDNISVARRIAEKMGITDVRAELLPGQKLTIVRELEQDRGVIAMIGDGVGSWRPASGFSPMLQPELSSFDYGSGEK